MAMLGLCLTYINTDYLSHINGLYITGAGYVISADFAGESSQNRAVMTLSHRQYEWLLSYTAAIGWRRGPHFRGLIILVINKIL